MTASIKDFDALAHELSALLSTCGKAQARCSNLIARQAAEIERLEAQAMQLRGAVIMRDTTLAWAREEHDRLTASIPGLPTRVALSRRVEMLTARLRAVMSAPSASHFPRTVNVDAANTTDRNAAHENLEASLVAADLVICQTGCLGHGDYWRVKDYCKRTGKPCLVVDQPDSVRIVRIHQAADDAVTQPCAEEP